MTPKLSRLKQPPFYYISWFCGLRIPAGLSEVILCSTQHHWRSPEWDSAGRWAHLGDFKAASFLYPVGGWETSHGCPRASLSHHSFVKQVMNPWSPAQFQGEGNWAPPLHGGITKILWPSLICCSYPFVSRRLQSVSLCGTLAVASWGSRQSLATRNPRLQSSPPSLWTPVTHGASDLALGMQRWMGDYSWVLELSQHLLVLWVISGQSCPRPSCPGECEGG